MKNAHRAIAITASQIEALGRAAFGGPIIMDEGSSATVPELRKIALLALREIVRHNPDQRLRIAAGSELLQPLSMAFAHELGLSQWD